MTDPSNNRDTYKYYMREAGERAERKPDETLANWTVAAAIFTGVLAMASVVGDGFSFWALRIIDGQLGEMRKAGRDTETLINANVKLANVAEVDERPWIGAPTIAITQGEHGEAIFHFNFKNIGRTPTTGLFITTTFSNQKDWESDVTHQCEWARTHVLDGGSKKFKLYSLVPQGTGIVSGERMASVKIGNPPTITAFRVKNDQQAPDGKTIVGCIIYGSRFDTNLKKTGFVGWVESSGGYPEVSNISVIDPD